MRRTLIVAALAAASLTVTASASFATDRASTNVRTGNRPTCGARGSLQVVGLTADQQLTCFRANSPGRARTIGTVSNLQTDTKLVGIDYRPADGNLYGAGDQGGIYTIDPATASASLMSRINVAGVPLALSGVSFGVDFNPAADRLRIVSDAGQNLRVKVDDGATNNDGFLNYVAGTPTTGIGGAAYVNNDADPNTNTTLFDFDAALDQIAIQSPPNNGSLVATGKFGVDSGPEVGADIYSRVKNGTTVENSGFAALNVGGTSQFFDVQLLTGKVASRGSLPAGQVLVGIAIPLDQ